jgi:hypothetical protein
MTRFNPGDRVLVLAGPHGEVQGIVDSPTGPDEAIEVGGKREDGYWVRYIDSELEGVGKFLPREMRLIEEGP